MKSFITPLLNQRGVTCKVAAAFASHYRLSINNSTLGKARLTADEIAHVLIGVKCINDIDTVRYIPHTDGKVSHYNFLASHQHYSGFRTLIEQSCVIDPIALLSDLDSPDRQYTQTIPEIWIEPFTPIQTYMDTVMDRVNAWPLGTHARSRDLTKGMTTFSASVLAESKGMINQRLILMHQQWQKHLKELLDRMDPAERQQRLEQVNERLDYTVGRSRENAYFFENAIVDTSKLKKGIDLIVNNARFPNISLCAAGIAQCDDLERGSRDQPLMPKHWIVEYGVSPYVPGYSDTSSVRFNAAPAKHPLLANKKFANHYHCVRAPANLDGFTQWVLNVNSTVEHLGVDPENANNHLVILRDPGCTIDLAFFEGFSKSIKMNKKQIAKVYSLRAIPKEPTSIRDTLIEI